MARHSTFTAADDEVIKRHICDDGYPDIVSMMAEFKLIGRDIPSSTVHHHVRALRAVGKIPKNQRLNSKY